MVTGPANIPLTTGVSLRPVAESDAERLARAYRRNREHLAPWDPPRDEAFFTTGGQRIRLRDLLGQRAAGRLAAWVLVGEEGPGVERQCTEPNPEPDPDGITILGSMTLSNIVGGPFRSANLGYWIDERHTRHGLASAALREVCRFAESELGLHRLEAGTLPTNTGSQRVLAKNGFTRIGVAQQYLFIAGAWQDHVLYQRILHTRPLG